MKCYHGTSADNLKSILKHGLRCDERKIWHPSQDAVYAWSVSELIKAEHVEPEYADDYAFKMAADNATITCANAKDCRIVVIEFDVPDFDNEVAPDESCDHMTGAVEIWRDIKPSEFLSVKVSNDLSFIKGFFIATALDRVLLNMSFSPLEEKVGKIFAENSTFLYDELYDFVEWETVK